jgi:hypothetical protein
MKDTTIVENDIEESKKVMVKFIRKQFGLLDYTIRYKTRNTTDPKSKVLIGPLKFVAMIAPSKKPSYDKYFIDYYKQKEPQIRRSIMDSNPQLKCQSTKYTPSTLLDDVNKYLHNPKYTKQVFHTLLLTEEPHGMLNIHKCLMSQKYIQTKVKLYYHNALLYMSFDPLKEEVIFCRKKIKLYKNIVKTFVLADEQYIPSDTKTIIRPYIYKNIIINTPQLDVMEFICMKVEWYHSLTRELKSYTDRLKQYVFSI